MRVRRLDLQRPHPRARRCARREGERLRITFVNGSAHPHTIHFHGIHPAEMDGVPGPRRRARSRRAAAPSTSSTRCPPGCTSTTATSRPLAEHIAKGLYGAFIIDPTDGRADADELVMVMNGFDTNFDRANEVYAANTIGVRLHGPADRGRSATSSCGVYLVNVLEYDLINSFHLHGNLFDYFPTGHVADAARAHRHGDAVPGPARDPRVALPVPRASYMFHAHQSEFTELGWQGFFEVDG